MKEYTIDKAFEVDLNKFKGFPFVALDAYDAAIDEDVYSLKKFTTTLSLTVSTREFNEYFEHILDLKGNLKDSFEGKRIINEQQNELLYFYHIVRRLHERTDAAIKRPSADSKRILGDYIKLIETIDQLSNDGQYKFKLTVQSKLKNIVLPMPKTSFGKEFYLEILAAVERHHLVNHPLSPLWSHLMLYKRSYTVSNLKAKYHGLPSRKPGRPRKLQTCVEALFLYSLIKTYPQFPPNLKVKNSQLTENQGDFIQRFLSLFGIANHSFKINLDRGTLEDDTIYNKKLRTDLLHYNTSRT